MRLAALLTLTLLIAACDSTEDPAALLVGTWEAESYASTVYIVVAETQTALDLSRPGTGELVVTGSEDGTFRHLIMRYSHPEQGPHVILSSAPNGVRSRPDARFMDLEFTREGVMLTVHNGTGGARSYYTPAPYESERVTLENGRISVDGLRLVQPSEGSEVVLNGILVYAQTEYPAGREAAFTRSQTAHEAGWLVTRFTFGADGSFESLVFGQPSNGTWASAGQGLVRTITNDGQAVQSYAYTVAGSTLVLENERSRQECNGACSMIETAIGLRPGTVVRSREVEEMRLLRTAP